MGPRGKKFTFKQGRKSISPFSSKSEYKDKGDNLWNKVSNFQENLVNKSSDNGSVTSSRDDHNNKQNKDVVLLIRYNDNIPSGKLILHY